MTKTTECSNCLEEISINDPTICEIYNLSKAQSHYSRESRLTPKEPLAKIFIDTAGKIIAAINEQRYATVIIDLRFAYAGRPLKKIRNKSHHSL